MLNSQLSTSLWGITTDIEETERMLDQVDSGDENKIAELQNFLMSRMSKDLPEKIDGVAQYNDHLCDLIDIVKKRILELDKLLTIIENRQENYNLYVKRCMEKLGVKEIKGKLRRVTIPKPRLNVEVYNKDELPASYVRVKKIIEPDKLGLLDALKAGDVIPGAKLVDGQTRVQFKNI